MEQRVIGFILAANRLNTHLPRITVAHARYIPIIVASSRSALPHRPPSFSRPLFAAAQRPAVAMLFPASLQNLQDESRIHPHRTIIDRQRAQ